MIKASQDPGLAAKAFYSFSTRIYDVNDLDCDIATEHGVVDHKHRAHAAVAGHPAHIVAITAVGQCRRSPEPLHGRI